MSHTGDPAEARIEAVPIDGGPRSVIVERASAPLWAPTGRLLFARDGALLAAPSDPQTGELLGEALPVIPAGVVGRLGDGGRPLALSPKGTLLYMPSDYLVRLVLWVDRDGAALPLDLPPEDYSSPRTSPDGRSLLLISPRGAEVLDLSRGTRARLAAGAGFPTWSAGGSRVVARHSNRLLWTAADGSADGASLPGAGVIDFPSAPGPDSDSILAVRIQSETSGDVYLFSISGAFEPRPLIASPAYEGGPQLSPDGRWLIYQSDASGRPEIYVARYPELGRRWPVSEGGGVQTRWGRDGREISYRNGRELVAVAFDGSGAEPSLGPPTPLFADEYDFGLGVSIANYDVAADGRFVMLRRTAGAGRLRLVLGWTQELERILAAGGVR